MRGLIEETRTDPSELSPSRFVDPLLSDCPARRRSCTEINFVGFPMLHPRPSIQLHFSSRATAQSEHPVASPTSRNPINLKDRGRTVDTKDDRIFTRWGNPEFIVMFGSEYPKDEASGER